MGEDILMGSKVVEQSRACRLGIRKLVLWRRINPMTPSWFLRSANHLGFAGAPPSAAVRNICQAAAARTSVFARVGGNDD